LLTGKFRRGEPAVPGTRLATRPDVLDGADWDVMEALAAFAAERDIGLLDSAIGWLAAQPAVASVIAGATRPEQVRANVAAAEWIPSEEDLATLDAITAPQR
jgi:aryl-alcohol dehydrogenase-like predicted oxidoreductase